jgi:hypothetical protein
MQGTCTQPRHWGDAAVWHGHLARAPRPGRPCHGWHGVLVRPVGALAVLAAVLVTGCGDSGEALKRLNPRSTPYLTGVPVPTGFSLVEKNSEDQESGVGRWARHLYRGSAPIQSVRNFYREQMPLQGWNRISDQNVKGTLSLRFEKANEACTVQISPTGFFDWCTIQIVVTPFNRTPTEPPLRRPMP